MKRFIKILTIFVLALVLVPNAKALNKDILTLTASESNSGAINVSGTAEDGMLAVAIQVYDESGTNLITMQTTSVQADNTFSETINVDAGTYLIKVADYDGGNYKEVTVKVKTSSATQSSSTTSSSGKNASNPDTSDNILFHIGLLLISTSGIIGSTLYLRKKKFVKCN